MKLEGLRFKSYRGTWYSIDRLQISDTTYYLMESEQYGDESQHLVVTLIGDNYLVVIDDEHSGMTIYDLLVEHEII
jgi:hypothetical protein